MAFKDFLQIHSTLALQKNISPPNQIFYHMSSSTPFALSEHPPSIRTPLAFLKIPYDGNTREIAEMIFQQTHTR